MDIVPTSPRGRNPADHSQRVAGGALVGAIGIDKKTDQLVCLDPHGRKKHAYLVGKTGSGKTALLQNLIEADILAGYGVSVLDPHGDLYQKALSAIPEHRLKDAVLFDASDIEFPVSYNPLYQVAPSDRSRVVDGLLYAFKNAWPKTFGESRMAFLLMNTLYALLESDKTETLLGVERFLTDVSYRERVLEHVRNPAVKSYWTDVFDSYRKQDQDAMVAPIHHHIGQLIADPITRNILGQTKNRIVFKDTIDNGHIFLANLSKGHVGRLASRFLGGLIVAGFQTAALGRANVSEDARRPYYLTIDECFAAGTPVLTSQGYKPIEDIKVGEKVVNAFGLHAVTNTMKRYVEELYVVKLKWSPLFRQPEGFDKL